MQPRLFLLYLVDNNFFFDDALSSRTTASSLSHEYFIHNNNNNNNISLCCTCITRARINPDGSLIFAFTRDFFFYDFLPSIFNFCGVKILTTTTTTNYYYYLFKFNSFFFTPLFKISDKSRAVFF